MQHQRNKSAASKNSVYFGKLNKVQKLTNMAEMFSEKTRSDSPKCTLSTNSKCRSRCCPGEVALVKSNSNGRFLIKMSNVCSRSDDCLSYAMS